MNVIENLNYYKKHHTSEMQYALKSFFSVLSGPFKWVEKIEGEWVEVDLNDFAQMTEHELYYVCAEYPNGRHIPLPILKRENEDDNKLQIAAISVAEKILDVKLWFQYFTIFGRYGVSLYPSSWRWYSDEDVIVIGPLEVWR